MRGHVVLRNTIKMRGKKINISIYDELVEYTLFFLEHFFDENCVRLTAATTAVKTNKL
jgi:hypothetical protein